MCAELGVLAAGAPRHRAGRPPSPDASERILRATWQLLSACGYAQLTMEAIAREAGAGLNTVYRRWKSKQELVADTLTLVLSESVPLVETGNIRADLESMLTSFCRYCASSGVDQVLAVVIGEAVGDPWWGQRLARDTQQRRKMTRPIVERAIGRGELLPDTDPDLLLDLLNGVIWQRVLLARQPATSVPVGAVVDAVLAGFAPPAPAGTAKRRRSPDPAAYDR